MLATRFVEDVLGQRSKVAVLRVLMREGAVTGRAASRKAGLSPRAAQLALRDLERVGVIRRRILGGAHLFSLNERRFGVAEGLRSLFAVESALPAAIAERLSAWLPRRQVLTLGIFGSVARGQSLPGSDLDLLVVVREAAAIATTRALLEDHQEEFQEAFGMRLSPHLIARRELAARFDRKDPLILNLIRESWILRGSSLGELVADGS